MVAGYLAGYQGEFRIPPKFDGVWQISSATEDGLALTLATNGSRSAGEFADAELIFSENRLTVVRTNGEAIVVEMRKVASGNEMKLELSGLGNDGKADGFSYAIMKRSGPKLLFAWVDSSATKIDSSQGGKQFVYTAVRPNSTGK